MAGTDTVSAMVRFVIACLLAACTVAAAVADELPRQQIVLASAISVDPVANTVILPLHEGEADGRRVWYILLDSSDAADAARRGLVHAPLLARAGHVQAVSRKNEKLLFAAAPDFRSRRQLAAGPQGFPPQQALPGATAPDAYSPFIRVAGDGAVLNAPIIAVGDGPFDVAGHSDTADRVLAIDLEKRTVTLLLSHGFAEGRAVVYISTEASDPAAAALERATLVPLLDEGDASIGLLVVVNGPRGREDAQGLQHFLFDAAAGDEAGLANAARLGSAGNILTGFPMGKTAPGYSPLWSVSPVEWPGTAAQRLRGQAEVYRLVADKNLRQLPPAGFAVNCPVIAWLDGPVP